MLIESEPGVLLGSDFCLEFVNIDYAALVMHAVYHSFVTLNKTNYLTPVLQWR